jgi:hypothetical protein
MSDDLIAAKADALRGWKRAYQAYAELLDQAERRNVRYRIKLAREGLQMAHDHIAALDATFFEDAVNPDGGEG